jgi:hypothetical protein
MSGIARGIADEHRFEGRTLAAADRLVARAGGGDIGHCAGDTGKRMKYGMRTSARAKPGMRGFIVL